MADNTTLNSGTGGDVIATDDVAGVKYQRVKLVDGTADSTAAIPGDATNGLDVDVTRVSGTVTIAGAVTNAGAFATQESGAALTALQLIDDAVATTAAAITTKGLAAVGTDGTNARILKTDAAGELQVDVLTMPTVTVTGTVTADTELPAAAALTDNFANPTTSNIAAMGMVWDGVAWDRAAGTSADGALVNLGANNDVTVTSGTITLGAGAATIGSLAANQSVNVAQINGVAATMGNGISGTGVQRVTLASDSTGQVTLAAGSATIGALTANQSVNNAQVSGVAISVGNGVSGTGVQRVTIASDSTGQVALATGSATVGNVGLAPRTSGGLTPYHLVSAATTNATVVKASAGQLYGYYIYNNATSMRKVAFHNTASAPTAGASIFFTVNLPASSAANVEFTMGIPFSAGIAFTTVTDNTDAGATAVAVGDLTINLFYN